MPSTAGQCPPACEECREYALQVAALNVKLEEHGKLIKDLQLELSIAKNQVIPRASSTPLRTTSSTVPSTSSVTPAATAIDLELEFSIAQNMCHNQTIPRASSTATPTLSPSTPPATVMATNTVTATVTPTTTVLAAPKHSQNRKRVLSTVAASMSEIVSSQKSTGIPTA